MKNVLMFTLGAAAGSLLTWKLVEQKYKKIADEEIESVIQVFKNRDKNVVVEHYNEVDKIDNVKREYTKKVNEAGYTTSISSEPLEEEKEEDLFTVQVENEDEGVRPYVISPEEYGDKNGYDARTYTYYVDNILTDEDDNIVGNPERYIGDGLEHFGDYDDCAVFVRNDNLKCDYEILKHNGTYDEYANGSY